MEHLLIKLQSFLQKASDGPITLADPDIEEFGERCKQIIRKQFTESREGRFRLRMSNVGKPLCQLQMEMGKATGEKPSYNQIVQNTYGDLLEALVILLIKGSGIPIQSMNERVGLDIGGIYLEGTYDIELENAIWDIKSVSPFSWDHKFGPTRGFRDVQKDDPFGYIPQGVLYSRAAKKPFGGWVAINKATGELNVIRAPSFDDYYADEVIAHTDEKIRALVKNAPFQRYFDDVVETFRKKPTGNRVLDTTCSYCPYKKPCWGKIEYKPNFASEAQNPKWHWYTHIDEKWKNEEVQEASTPPWE